MAAARVERRVGRFRFSRCCSCRHRWFARIDLNAVVLLLFHLLRAFFLFFFDRRQRLERHHPQESLSGSRKRGFVGEKRGRKENRSGNDGRSMTATKPKKGAAFPVPPLSLSFSLSP